MSESKTQQQDRRHSPWNKGLLVGQKRPLKPKEVWNIRARLQIEARKRDLAMFNLAIDSKLRGCDLVSLKIDDICVGGRLRDRATIVQKKTGRPVQFELTEQTRASVEGWLAILKVGEGRFLFPSRVHEQPHISTRQYARIVHGWIKKRRYGRHCVWHAFDAANQGGADLQKDRQPESGSALAWAYKAGEHRPIPRDRGG
jgi:integrase